MVPIICSIDFYIRLVTIRKISHGAPRERTKDCGEFAALKPIPERPDGISIICHDIVNAIAGEIGKSYMGSKIVPPGPVDNHIHRHGGKVDISSREQRPQEPVQRIIILCTHNHVRNGIPAMVKPKNWSS